MGNGVKNGRQVKQGRSCNLTLVNTNDDIGLYFQ